MPRAGHVWACVLFRGACVVGSRVLDGGMCGACVFFGFPGGHVFDSGGAAF